MDHHPSTDFHVYPPKSSRLETYSTMYSQPNP